MGESSAPGRAGRGRPARVTLLLAAGALLSVGVSACASFADASPRFSARAALTPPVATIVPPSPQLLPGSQATTTPGRTTPPVATSTPAPDSMADPTSPPPAPSGSTTPPASSSSAPPATTPPATTPPAQGGAPCTPPELPVVAVCLDHPWGMAPLPGGKAALVGERATGKILRVTASRDPELITTITQVDASHGGGLMGLALSPYYVEDRLVYAYVTTAEDARILRIAPDQAAQPIVTGLPVGGDNPGGAITFGADGLLYVATGGDAADASPLAHAVLRFDAFGNPAADNASQSAVFATGLSDPTGICRLPTGDVGVIDHRADADMLIAVADGGTYATLASGDALWRFRAADGGARDCAVSAHQLLATLRTKPGVVRIHMTAAGSFVGTPETAVPEGFGQLRTITPGPGDIPWVTTANVGAGQRAPGSTVDPSDDRVFLLPSGGGGGSGGID